MVPGSLCPNTNPLALDDLCIRASWSAIFPAILVFLLCVPSIPAPPFVKRLGSYLSDPFQPFLTVVEAEALSSAQPIHIASVAGTRRTTLVLVSLALVEILLWIGVGVFEAISGSLGTGVILPFIFVTSWFYAFLRPLSQNPIITAPMDLFWLFSLESFGAIMQLGGVLLGYGKATQTMFIVFVCNTILATSLLIVVLRLPLEVPTREPLPDDPEPSPEDYTSLFGWMTFTWIFPLIRRGAINALAEKDVWDLSPTMQARPVFQKFKQLRQSTLLHRLWVSNSSDLLLDASLSILSVILNLSGPFFMNLILSTLEQPVEGGKRLTYLYVFLAFACQLAKCESDVMHYFYGRRASIRMNTELMVAIYEKTLKRCDFAGIVDAEAKAEATAVKDAKGRRDGTTRTSDSAGKQGEKALGAQLGRIVNLMSVDTNTVKEDTIAPVEIILSVLFLYRCLGWAAFSGVIFMIFFIPINWVVAKLNVKYQKGITTARDKRTSVVNELISSIKFIKFGGGEERWLEKVNNAREVELSWLLLPLLISVSSFYVYVWQGNVLTVATAFTGGVALSRISTFLEEDEVSDEVSTLKPDTQNDTVPPGLAIDGSFKWNELARDAETKPSEIEILETRFELQDISVAFPEGKITCVVGPTASGKTALLQALLGEMTCLPGTQVKPPKSSKVDGNGLMHCISYCAQTPWLQYASIKDNITFGFPLDEERYQTVLDACALLPDLAILPDGDRTEIGIRGVTLSGGQKARVALARAIYAWTKYVLLDDPLSAVDSHTARALFDKLFCGPLLKNRTVVLITHHLDLLLSGQEGSGAHYLVRMLDGRIDAQGTVQDLRARGLLEVIKHDLKDDLPADTTVEEPAVEESDSKNESKPVSSQPITKLVEDEERAEGDWRIYKTYLQASGYKIWVFITLLVIGIEVFTAIRLLWLNLHLIWGEAYPSASGSEINLILSRGFHQANPFLTFWAPTSGFPSAEDNPMFYVAIYTLIGLLVVVLNTALAGLHFYGAFRLVLEPKSPSQFLWSSRASRHLFHELLNKLVHSTFRWFDTTPKGRILNRIGKDISAVDNTLSERMYNLTHMLAALIIQILIVTAVFPFFLVPGLLLFFAYYTLSMWSLPSSRDLRRMEANTRSPIFTAFRIVTVRAFGVEKHFLDGMLDKVDLTTRVCFFSYCQLVYLNARSAGIQLLADQQVANHSTRGSRLRLTKPRWLLLNFDYLGAVAVLLTSLLSVATSVPAGLAGICITVRVCVCDHVYYDLELTDCAQADLNAVERVVNYLEIPQEPPAIIHSNRPPAYWPSSSSNNDLLVVEDLEVKYAPHLPSVLHRISFTLKARERIGVLGRTGSGKSTLAMSLLRFVEPTTGRIVVDGIDISTIGLHDLRTRLTFIPQDAVLFGDSTIRDNLDPFDEYEDSELESALYRVHLLNQGAHQSQRTSARGSPVAELEADTEAASVSRTSSVTDLNPRPVISLDTMVSAEGANFSHGQRQLIAMARALLRQSSIIILDEATSSIDFETDQKIQKTIREEFKNSLLVTIAHRINTVIDYDRLLILDQGKIAQFDTPHNLIQTEGIFRDMCNKTGTFSELEAAALKAAGDRK
ncbi:hypothetical protein C8R45DRAFT_1049577 [Mycena sanguinolenta]|nr:hypothetical protein C8R45DRAFT_1049577 [Mycena sanguinolenta]